MREGRVGGRGRVVAQISVAHTDFSVQLAPTFGGDIVWPTSQLDRRLVLDCGGGGVAGGAAARGQGRGRRVASVCCF